ncbi:MAG: very short patch repair endonuclease [Fimbriimonadaceae bacterium]|nr:very short patch repair endonuclease [Fimbriimonadaceae bacterium]
MARKRPPSARYSFAEMRETLVVAESTRKSMQANRGKDTSTEVRLRRALWAAGARGYRKNVARLPGKPDLAFGKARVAVFVHGCFWHRCERCGRYRLPKTNTAYWQAKVETNVARHAQVVLELEARGWRVLTFWECELKEDLGACVEQVREALP